MSFSLNLNKFPILPGYGHACALREFAIKALGTEVSHNDNLATKFVKTCANTAIRVTTFALPVIPKLSLGATVQFSKLFNGLSAIGKAIYAPIIYLDGKKSLDQEKIQKAKKIGCEAILHAGFWFLDYCIGSSEKTYAPLAMTYLVAGIVTDLGGWTKSLHNKLFGTAATQAPVINNNYDELSDAEEAEEVVVEPEQINQDDDVLSVRSQSQSSHNPSLRRQILFNGQDEDIQSSRYSENEIEEQKDADNVSKRSDSQSSQYSSIRAANDVVLPIIHNEVDGQEAVRDVQQQRKPRMTEVQRLLRDNLTHYYPKTPARVINQMAENGIERRELRNKLR
ncbi:MAG: hypothetical protein WCT85_06825 [Parachlamydiales bacterium]|jgi:hypothetical protein